jgi:hypothetical protein
MAITQLIPQDGDLLLPSAAARVAGCSAAAVRTWLASGRLPAVPLSGGWRAIRRGDLERFLRQREASAR